jgi:hypothetical protein
VTPRRGITPAEAALLGQRGAGADAAYPQAAAVGVFGRLYGQGVTETAAAFECACARAARATFVKDAPNNCHVMDEKLSGRLDTAACTVVDIEGFPSRSCCLSTHGRRNRPGRGLRGQHNVDRQGPRHENGRP